MKRVRKLKCMLLFLIFALSLFSATAKEFSFNYEEDCSERAEFMQGYTEDSCLYFLATQENDNRYCALIVKENLKDSCYSNTSVALNSYWGEYFIKRVLFSIIFVGIGYFIAQRFSLKWQRRFFYTSSLGCIFLSFILFLDEWKFNYLVGGGIGHHIHSIIFNYFILFWPLLALLIIFFSERFWMKKIPKRFYPLLTRLFL